MGRGRPAFEVDKHDGKCKLDSRYAFHRKSRDIDDMRQALIEHGNLDPENLADFDDRVAASLRGNPQYTARGSKVQAEQEALENEEAERAYWEAQDGKADDVEQAQDELRDAPDELIDELDDISDDTVRTLTDEEAEAFWNDGTAEEADGRPDEGVAEDAVRADSGRGEA